MYMVYVLAEVIIELCAQHLLSRQIKSPPNPYTDTTTSLASESSPSSTSSINVMEALRATLKLIEQGACNEAQLKLLPKPPT